MGNARAGLRQRITALNMLIDDLYHDRKVVRDGVLPEHVVATAKGFRPQCVGLNPPRGVWCHITGTDLVRDTDGQYYVLEDNLRCPSGVSYVLQNRQLMKQTFPQLFERSAIRPVDDYCSRLLDALQYLMGDQTRSPTVALFRPACTTRPTSNTRFSPSRWGSTWSRDAIWSFTMASSTCGRRKASSGSTSCTAGSMTTSSIRKRSGPIRCWACRG